MTALEELQKFNDHFEGLKQRREGGRDGFDSEYSELKARSNGYKRDAVNYPTTHGQQECNRYKNRYKDILPYDHSRVILPSSYGVKGSDYINANYIKGPEGETRYIAAQAPLPYTLEDFWRMLWYNKTNSIVMACKLIEAGKKKCQQYWTEVGEEVEYAGVTITVKNEKWINENFVVRKIIAILEGERLSIQHFHYTAWPDHGVPESPQPLIELLDYVHDHVKVQKHNPPLVIHCSAGCGRTGVICVVDYVWNLLNSGDYDKVDIFEIVGEMRKQRHAIVQTKEQYEFVYKTVAVLIDTKVMKRELHTYVNVEPREEKRNSNVHKYENVTLKPALSNKPDTPEKQQTTEGIKPKKKPPQPDPAVGLLISIDDNADSAATAAMRQDIDVLDSILNEYSNQEDSRCPLSIPADVDVPPKKQAARDTGVSSQGGTNDDYVIADLQRHVQQNAASLTQNNFDNYVITQHGQQKETTNSNGDYVVAQFDKKKDLPVAARPRGAERQVSDNYVNINVSGPPPKQTTQPVKQALCRTSSAPGSVEEKAGESKAVPVVPRRREQTNQNPARLSSYQNVVIQEAPQNHNRDTTPPSQQPMITTDNAVLGSSTARDRKTGAEARPKPPLPQRPVSQERLVTKIKVSDTNSAQPKVKPYKLVEVGSHFTRVGDMPSQEPRKTSQSSPPQAERKTQDSGIKTTNIMNTDLSSEAGYAAVDAGYAVVDVPSKNKQKHSNVPPQVPMAYKRPEEEEDGYAAVSDFRPIACRESPKKEETEELDDGHLYASVPKTMNRTSRLKLEDSDDEEPPPMIPAKTAGAFNILTDPVPPPLLEPRQTIHRDSESQPATSKSATMEKLKRGFVQGWNQMKHNIGDIGGLQDSDQRMDIPAQDFSLLPALSINPQIEFKNRLEGPKGARPPPAHWTSYNFPVN